MTPQGLRFVLTGGTVSLIYLATATTLADIVGVPFQVALAVGFSVGLVVHFTLQRHFVWRHREAFALPLGKQTGRYLTLAATQYSVIAASTSFLPPLLGVPTELVFLVTSAVVTCINFLLFRNLIFHATTTSGEGASERRSSIAKSFPRAGADGSAHRSARSSPVGRIAALLQSCRPAVIDAAIATLAVLLVASPMLFTDNAFAPDFTNAIWLINYQEHAIAANLHPTLFLNTDQIGIFEPLFVFYGGTLYSLAGALGALLGGATITAFELTILAAMAAAYGGFFWLARQLGVRGLMAHAPAIAFATSAYYVSDIYGRGDLAEFTAISVLPLLVAATLRVVRGPWRVAPAACLIAAAAIQGGSHNITLLLATTIMGLALAVYWIASGLPRALPWRGLLTAAGLITLGVALDAWVLIPDIAYAFDTVANAQEISWNFTAGFNTASVIFDPLRTVPSDSTSPALYIQAPVLALAWGLIALPLMWRYRRLRAGAIAALVVLGCLLAAIMSHSVFMSLPRAYRDIEFSYRMQSYVTLVCVCLVLLGALALTRRARDGRAGRVDVAMKLGLGAVVAFGIGLCTWQLWVPNTQIPGLSYSERGEALAGPADSLPSSWYSSDQFGDHALRLVSTQHAIGFNPESVHDDRFTGRGRVPSGPFATNIDGGPNLVRVSGGVHVVGRTSRNTLVLERNEKGSGPVEVEVRGRPSTPVVVGRIITVAAAALLLALAAYAAVRRLRKRRSVATVARRPSPIARSR
jgi:putative flippase GtrA